jgi:hypothetical protein
VIDSAIVRHGFRLSIFFLSVWFGNWYLLPLVINQPLALGNGAANRSIFVSLALCAIAWVLFETKAQTIHRPGTEPKKNRSQVHDCRGTLAQKQGEDLRRE